MTGIASGHYYYKYTKFNIPIITLNLVRVYQEHASQPNARDAFAGFDKRLLLLFMHLTVLTRYPVVIIENWVTKSFLRFSTHLSPIPVLQKRPKRTYRYEQDSKLIFQRSDKILAIFELLTSNIHAIVIFQA